MSLGGSAIYIGSIKKKETEFFLYDVFDMIPPPSSNDDEDVHQRYEKIVSGESNGINGNLYYGYQKDLLTVVKNNFKNFNLDIEKNNIHFIKSKFQDKMSITQPVAFAHLDCDWYESVKYCLDEIHPNLSIGGEILIDDYFHYSGCRKAVDEFLALHSNTYRTFRKAKLHIIKIN